MEFATLTSEEEKFRVRAMCTAVAKKNYKPQGGKEKLYSSVLALKDAESQAGSHRREGESQGRRTLDKSDPNMCSQEHMYGYIPQNGLGTEI